MDGIHEDFDTPQTSSLTLFKALFGDFDFDGFSTPEEGGGNEILLQAAHFFIIIYVLVASIVLLNILIAMMAKTFGMKFIYISPYKIRIHLYAMLIFLFR